MNREHDDFSYNDNFRILKRIPLVIILVMVLMLTVFISQNKNMLTVENIASYVPDNLFLAAIVLFVLFGIKSLSVVFPLSLLYLTSGFLFPKYLAILISTLGLLVAISIPYVIGLFCGQDLITSITSKYPRAKQLQEYQDNNRFFLCFITRMVGVLPADVLSLYFGACKIPYSIYAISSIAGSLVSIVTMTLLGTVLTNPLSKEFLLVLLCKISVTIVSIVIHRMLLSSHNNKKTVHM